MPALAVRASRVPRRHRLSAQDVLALGHGLKVSRIHASRDAAQVVDLQAPWDRSIGALIGDAMRIPLATFPDDPVRHARVNLTQRRTEPNPATRIRLRFPSRVENFPIHP